MSAHAYIPKGPLADYLSLVWEVNGPGRIQETILPRGIVEIVFQFDEPVLGQLPRRSNAERIPRCFLQGFNTHVIRGTYGSRQHLLGLQLRVHRVRDLLGILPSELIDTTVDLALIRADLAALWSRLAEADSFPARLNILQHELPVLRSAACNRSAHLDTLMASGGVEEFRSVEALAGAVCYSTKQLGRISRQLFGIPTEMLTGYKKFMESVRAMHRPHSSLTSVAYEAGFCDQAHFTRVFKSFSGMTPGEYRDRRSTLPFHIF
ncbi:helix-turn-helix domain-containing protein [Flaviaesturariibacter terrae]